MIPIWFKVALIGAIFFSLAWIVVPIVPRTMHDWASIIFGAFIVLSFFIGGAAVLIGLIMGIATL